MSIILMVCFARSGATILNQCLGSLPDVVMMSEVSPLGGGMGRGLVSYRTIKSQAKQWYGIDLKSDEDDFAACAIELERICDKEGKHLIIRDWNYVNFVPDKRNDYDPPNQLLSLEVLKDRCELITFAFVRDAIDIWISFKFKRIRNYNDNDFFKNYLKFVNCLIENRIPLFRYEDFVLDPEMIVRNICKYAGLTFSNDFRNYYRYEKVNGDNQHGNQSRGFRANKIKQLPRKIIAKHEIERINQSKDLKEANSLLQYQCSYEEKGRERIFDMFFDEACYITTKICRKFKKIGNNSFLPMMISKIKNKK